MIVQDRQTVFDIALQELGSLGLVFDLLDANELDINAELSQGQELNIPDAELDNSKRIKKYIKDNSVIIVSIPAEIVVKGDFKAGDFKAGDFKTE